MVLPRLEILDAQSVESSEYAGLKTMYRSAQAHNIDVVPIRSILCHEGPNDNGDYFERELMAKNYATLVFKPIRWLHRTLVGVVTDAAFRVPPQESADPRAYIEYAGLLWKFYVPDAVSEILDAYESGRAFSSMEVWYTQYEILHGDNRYPKGSPEAERLYPMVGRLVNGKPVYFVFKEYIFGGAGIVLNPADNDATILSLGSKKEMSDSELAVAQAQALHEVNVPLMSSVGDDSKMAEQIDHMTISTKAQALFGHAILHRWWRNPSATNWTRDQIKEEHTRVVRALVERYGSGCFMHDGLYDSLPQELKDRIKALKEEASLEEEHRTLEKVLDLLEGGSTKLEELESLRNELAAVKQSVSELSAAKAALEKTNSELTAQVASLMEELKKKTDELAAVNAKLAEKTAELEKIQTEARADRRVAELKQSGVVLDEAAWASVRNLVLNQDDATYEIYKASLLNAIAAVKSTVPTSKDTPESKQANANVPPINPTASSTDEEKSIELIANAMVFRQPRGLVE